jgi:hypothetical protein
MILDSPVLGQVITLRASRLPSSFASRIILVPDISMAQQDTLTLLALRVNWLVGE